MNSGSAAVATAPRFPDLQHHFDAGQAAEQVSHLATDIGCAVECVSFVLRELSTVCAANNMSPMASRDLSAKLPVCTVPQAGQAATPDRLTTPTVLVLKCFPDSRGSTAAKRDHTGNHDRKIRPLIYVWLLSKRRSLACAGAPAIGPTNSRTSAATA